MLHCKINVKRYVQCTMSKQLAIAAAFSTFALSALALFAPGSADVGEPRSGAAMDFAAPDLAITLPFAG
jgi:hypothetical protein